MIVLLLPVGPNRFELYSEPADEPLVPPGPEAGRLRRWMHVAGVQWRALVENARRGTSTGTLARWRDGLVRRLADMMAEQRILSAFRDGASATLLIPTSLTQSDAERMRNRVLARARLHHAFWATVDALLLIASAILAPVPGPNVIAYYLVVRLFGHVQAWRGAGRARHSVTWTLRSDDALTELASLTTAPRDVRAARVQAMAMRLNLPHLSSFFERVAV